MCFQLTPFEDVLYCVPTIWYFFPLQPYNQSTLQHGEDIYECMCYLEIHSRRVLSCYVTAVVVVLVVLVDLDLDLVI